jgi:uncharacterized repeat protein (TIGR01451 family)
MRLFRKLSKLSAACLATGTLACASTANAQSFVDTATIAINDNTLCPGATGSGGAGTTVANVSRTVNVTGVANITDVNLGLIANHSWRGDMRVTLTPPAATGIGPILLITEDTSNSGNVDDYNIELDDEAGIDVNTGTTDSGGPHDVAEAPYQWSVRPDNLLSSFDGVSPNGTWTLDICDDYAGQSGSYIRSELIFQVPGVADLSLAMTSGTNLPETGTVVPLTVTLLNGGLLSATSTVSIPLPAGVTYDSQSGDGVYDDVTGIWTPPASLADGDSAILTLNVIVTTQDSYTINAEVLTSNRTDSDSTPGNSSTTEDDDASVTLLGQSSPTKPNLTCPIGDRFTHAWTATGANSWPAGVTTTQSYPPTGTAVPAGEERLVFEISGDTPQLQQSAGVNTPVVQSNVTGGIAPADPSLHIAVDYGLQSQSITFDLDVGEPGVGVDSLQFSIFDVDLGGWIDRITVTGSLDGASRTAVLTRSGSNFVDGNAAIGSATATNTTDNGNIDVTFLSAVDSLQFVYDNHPDVGVDPAFQIISLHEITTCPRTMADLNAVKTVEVNDPGNLGLYMTPGNEVLYKITVTNSATATAVAEDVDISDTLPTNLRFISASTTGFSGGGFGTPDLPVANTDCEDTPCVIRFSGGDVPINTTAEILVVAEIK